MIHFHIFAQEGSQYVRGFGGIGGMLRYTVDFQVDITITTPACGIEFN